jgi:DnaK suppressor protein
MVAQYITGIFSTRWIMENKTAILQRELDDLRLQITALERKLGEKPDYGLGAGAPAVTQWELDQAMLRQFKERAAKMEHMLSQTVETAYGICERCGEPIHPDRLAVLPDTRVCIQCARAGGH